MSSTLDRVDWNAELVRGDLGKAVQQLKLESGKGLLVGGIKLPLALAELGLIDEDDASLLHLSTVPASWRSTSVSTPVAEREAVLFELLASVPDTRLLFLQGQPDAPEGTAVRMRLAARFHGWPLQNLTDCLQTERPTRRWDELSWLLHGDRGILLSVGLAHEAEDGYWERAADIIRNFKGFAEGPETRSAGRRPTARGTPSSTQAARQ